LGRGIGGKIYIKPKRKAKIKPEEPGTDAISEQQNLDI
jgi:hypothetical protein